MPAAGNPFQVFYLEDTKQHWFREMPAPDDWIRTSPVPVARES
jgi:hypothetical protein